MSRQRIQAVLTSRTTWLTGSLLVTALLTTAVAEDRANERRLNPSNRPSTTRPSAADRPVRSRDNRTEADILRKMGARGTTQPGDGQFYPPSYRAALGSAPAPGTPASALRPGRYGTEYAGPPAPVKAPNRHTGPLDTTKLPDVSEQELERKAAAARASVGVASPPGGPAPGAPGVAPVQSNPPAPAKPPTVAPVTNPPGAPAPSGPVAHPTPPAMPPQTSTPGTVPPIPSVPTPGAAPGASPNLNAAAPATAVPATAVPATAVPATAPAANLPLPQGVSPLANGTTTAPAGVTVNANTGMPEVKPKAFYWLTPEERPYFIGWNNVTIEKACHDLEEMTGLSMIGLAQLDPATKAKTLTFQGTKLMNYDQALTKVNELLVELGVWVVRREDNLVVRQLSEWYQHIGPDRRYDSLESYRNAKLPLWEVAAVVYDQPLLRQADVIASHAMDVVPFNTARITIVPGTSHLELKGFVYFIEQQIKDIERNSFVADDGRTWVAYELKHANTSDAVRLLQMMVQTPDAGAVRPVIPRPPQPNVPGQPQPAAESPGTSTADQIEIQEDTRLSRVMVRASKSNHEKVKSLLDTYIDLPLKPGVKSELIVLEHADPATVVSIVQPLLGERQMYQPPVPQPRPPQPGVNPQPQPQAPPAQVVQVGTTAVLTPIAARNAILVKANPDEMTTVKEYIKMVDVEGTQEKFQYISLKFGSANSVVNILNTTFGQRPRAGGSPFPGGDGNQQFRATADMQSDRGLVITGAPKDMDDAKLLIEQLDVDPDEGAMERVVTLEHSSANTLAEMLNGRYGRSNSRYSPGGGGTLPRFIADDASHSVIVVCRESMWKDIERLIKEIDDKSQIRGITKTYRLKHARAQNVAVIMSQSFGRSASRHGGEDPDSATFQAESQTNVLVVTAMDDIQERIAKLIEEVDQPSPSEDADLHTIELASADPNYVADKIEELFHQQGGYRSDRMQVPVNAVAEPVSNRVLITASEDDFKKAEELAKQIDKDYASRQYSRKTFHLEHVSSMRIERALELMFPQNINRNRGEATAGGVRFAEVGSDIVVSAPKDKMDEIENLIKQLDSDPSKNNEIRSYRVKGGGENGTEEIARSLEQLFGRQRGGGGDYEGGYGRRGGGASIQFIGDRGSDLLFVSAPTSRMAEIDAKIQEMLKARGENDLTLSIREFDVAQARAEDVVDMVQPLLNAKYEELQRSARQYGGGNLSVSAHPSGKRVMVAGPAVLMTLAEELIKKFDEPALPSTMRIVTLKTAKAVDIAPVIEQNVAQHGTSTPTFRSSSRRRHWGGGDWGGNSWNSGNWGTGSSSNRSGEAGELQVTPVEANNSLILRGPDDKVAEAEKLAKQLDAGAIPEGPMIKVFEIKDADVYEVVSMIEELVGGGSDYEDSYSSYGSSSSSRKRGGSSGGSVVVKPDFENRIIVSAPADKFPMIEQLIETKESLAKLQKASGKEDEAGTIVKGGELIKTYNVKGPLNEIAKALDDSLVSILGYFDAPYVKTSTLANQIIVQGKPAHFKLVEQYLAELEKNPPKPIQAVLIRQIPSGMAKQVLTAVEAHAPSTVKMNVQPLMGRADRERALRKIREIDIDTPITPTTEPSPFVPPNTLAEIQQSVSELSWAQAPHITVSTQPAATTRPAAATTQPAARAPQAPAAAAPAVAPAPTPAPPAPVALAPAAPAAKVPVTVVPAAAPVPAPAEAAGQVGEVEPATGADMAKAATDAIATGQVQIRYDEDSGLIYAVGPEAQLAEVQKLIDDLVTQIEKLSEAGGDRPIRVFQVNYVDVTVAATILEQMFNDRAAKQVPGQPPQPGQQPQAQQQQQQQQAAGKKPGEDKNAKDDEKSDSSRRRREDDKSKTGAGSKSAAGGERIRVFPDVRTRTLIIRADKEDFPVVAELLVKIDRPGDRPPVDIKIFEITKLNAFDVEQAIKAILKIEDNRQGMYGGQMFGGGMSGFRGGYPGNYSAQAQMVEQLQQQMLELQSQGVDSIAGDTGEGKTKINPAKDITITSDATTNTVIVSAPSEGMKLVETLINRLEKITVPVQIVTFPLKNADADKVATELEKLFQGAGSRAAVIGGGPSGRPSRGGGSSGFRGGMGGGMGGGASTSTRLGQELKVTADARTNTIVVRALEADMPKIKELIDKLDIPGTGQVELYPVEHGSAVALAESLTKMFADAAAGRNAAENENAVRITADADTNTILVSAPPAKQAIIGARIQEMDKRVSVTRVPKQIPLMVANATDVAEKLQAIFVPKGSGGKGVKQITIEGDDNSGILFVTAPQEMIKEIETIAKTLDTKTRTDVQVFNLKYAYATEVHGIFKDMLTQAMTKLRGGKANADEVPVVTPDARTNSLIVMGTPAVFLAVERVLKDVDVPPKDTSTQTVAMFGLTKATAANVAQTINAGAPAWPKTTGVQPPSAVAEPTSNVVYVYGTKAQIDQIKTTIIDPLEKYQPAVDAVVQDYQIPVKFAKVEEVSKTLSQYFQGKAQNASAMGVTSLPPADRAVAIIPDPATRQLLVTASEKNKKLIDQLLTQMDTPLTAGSARETKVFPLQYADPSSTALGITTAFAKTGQVSEIEQVKVVPEGGTNSVVVSASSENMKKIEAMLLDLDRPNGGQAQKPYTIDIVNAEPEDVATALNEVYVNTRGRTRTGRLPISITVPRGSRTLLVSCTEPELAELKTLVAQLDQAKDKARDVRMVRVEHIPVDEMVNLLTEYMRRSGRGGRDSSLIADVKIVASNSASAVLLTGPPQRLDDLEKLVARIDQASPTTQPTGRLVKVYPLKNADPTSVAGLISQTFTKPGSNVAENDRVTALAEWTTNSVVVNANANKQQEITALIEDIDKESTTAPQQAIIKLEYARAEDLANVLNVTYRSGRRGRQGDQPVMISADANTNSLIVSAGKADIEGIKTTVATLDKPAGNSIEELRIIPLTYIDAAETLTILQEYLRKPGGGKSAAGTNLVGDIRLQASATLNALVVSGAKENIDAVEKRIKAMDVEMPNAGTAPRIIKLENASAAAVAANLTRIFSDQNRTGRKSGEVVPLVLADDSTNSLIVRARPVDYNNIEEMAHTLDTKTPGLTTIDVVPVSRGVDVAKLAQEIAKTINDGEQVKARQQPGYRPAQVSIGTDERGPALIVAGSPELFKTVRDLVGKLDDIRPMGAQSATIVVPTRYLQPNDMKRIIEQMIRAQKPVQSSSQKR